MAGAFDFTGQFPSAEVINAMQQAPLLQQKLNQQKQDQILQTMQAFGQAAQSISERKRRMAAAMTLAQNPGVQSTLSGNDNQVATVGGQPVTQGQTAAYDPTNGQVTPNAQGPLSASQIEPLLPEAANSDYFGQINKINQLQAMKQRMMNNNTTSVVTTDANGNVTGVQSVVGAHRPVVTRPSAPKSAGGKTADPRTVLVNTRKQLASAVTNSYGPAQQAAQQQLSAFDQQHPELGIPTGPQAQAVGPNDTDLATMKQHPVGTVFTLHDGTKWKIDGQSGQAVQVS